MLKVRAHSWLLALAALAIVFFALKTTEVAMGESANSAAGTAAEELHRLFATEWDYEMQWDPVRASQLGDRRWNDRWPDASLESLRRDRDHRAAALDKLQAIDRTALSATDRISADFFRRLYEEQIEEYGYHWFLVPGNQREGIQTTDELAEELRFETVKDYEDWIARMRSFPAYLDQTIGLMREGMKERIVLPKVIMERIPAQIARQVVPDPESSGFFKPFRQFPATISEVDRTRLAREGRDAVRSDVVPAFQRFQRFFSEEYLPACFDEVGIWQVPRGEEMYAFFVRKYTTTKMTPAEVHAMGLREVARINAEMRRVMEQTGFQGSRAEFFHYLRTDPQFFYKSPDDLLMAYRATAKRIDPHLVKIFRLLPRMPYGVEPIPEVAAPDTTAAYYRTRAADGSRAGTFMVNLYKPEERPKWEMMALALHESVPGHHLQIALAMEQKDLPNFRRYGYVRRVR